MNRFKTASFVAAVALSVAACNDAAKAGSDGAAPVSTSGAPNNGIDLAHGPGDYFDLTPSRDGRITYSRVVDGYAAIFVADSNGNSRKRLTTGVWDFAPLFSPDGKWIAFGRETNAFDVLVVSSDSGEARPLAATGARENIISWLPDGSGVLYLKQAGSRAEIWVATLDGKQSVLIARDGDVYGNASPDGKSLVYHLVEKGKRTLWLYDFATKKSRQLTTEGYETIGQALGIWSPDSKRVTYESKRSGTIDIFTIDVATGATRQITTDVRDDTRPRFSPDGSRIAFISNRGGQVDAWVVSDTGGDPVRVTDDRAIEGTPEWMRDGKSLLVESNNGESHAFIASVSGGAPRRLMSGDVQQTRLSLSRDGKLAAITTFDGSQNDVAVVSTSDGKSIVVADGPSDEAAADISPDGQKVAFMSNHAGSLDIYTVPVTGGAATRLLDWPSDESAPAWSPDGQWIAFGSGHESPSDVWLVKPDGTGARRLTKLGGVSDFHWSHDGKMIVVSTTTGRGLAVYAVSVGDGSMKTIADGTYGRASFAPGDSLILLANLAEGMSRHELRRLDGSIARVLSDTTKPVYEPEGRVSPDGTMRAFPAFTFKDNDYLPTVQPIAGGPAKTLFQGRGNTQDLEWMPDGKSIVYIFRGNDLRMVRVPMK